MNGSSLPVEAICTFIGFTFSWIKSFNLNRSYQDCITNLLCFNEVKADVSFRKVDFPSIVTKQGSYVEFCTLFLSS